MNLLIIKQDKEHLSGFINYLGEKHPSLKVAQLIMPQYVREKFYRKRKMIAQFFLNFFYSCFNLTVLNRKKYDFILLNGILVSIPCLILSKFLPFAEPRKSIIVTNFFIHRLSANKFVQRILKFLMGRSRVILVVQSEYDKTFYSKLLHKTPAKVIYFHYCLGEVPTNDKYGKDQDYIFTGGFSNRDYECLFKTAKNIKHNFIIICSSLNKLPFRAENVCILRDVDFDVFNGYLKNSKMVIIPIKYETGASGHMLALSAMFFKKPIVYADALCISDYFKPNVTGVSYRRGDAFDLVEKIEDLLSNSQKRTELGNVAYKEYREVYHISNYYRFLAGLFYQDAKENESL